MLLQILRYDSQNPISVMINYMLVVVKALLYLTPPKISCIHQNVPSPYPTYYMFHILKKKDYYLFNNFVVKILSFLHFTLLFSMSRISPSKKFSFPVRVKMVFMSFSRLLPQPYRKHFCPLTCPLLPIFGIVDSVILVHSLWFS
jgi:hypothetical protein